MAIDHDTVRSLSAEVDIDIDWRRMFPGMFLGPHRRPRELAAQIRKDVEKLKSLSDAGRLTIRQARCARAGITIHGEPRFFISWRVGGEQCES